MDIKGCGGANDILTFYQIQGDPTSAEVKGTRVKCGQRAESSGGRRGILLCAKCAANYTFKPARKANAISIGGV
jgi:hypothetical protein